MHSKIIWIFYSTRDFQTVLVRSRCRGLGHGALAVSGAENRDHTPTLLLASMRKTRLVFVIGSSCPVSSNNLPSANLYV